MKKPILPTTVNFSGQFELLVLEGSVSFTIAVPEGVPSLSHKVHPFASTAEKYNLFPNSVRVEESKESNVFTKPVLPLELINKSEPDRGLFTTINKSLPTATEA